jgi:hypothetical protein
MNRALWITIAGIVVFLLYTCVAPALLSSDDFIFITLGLLAVALPIVAGAMYLPQYMTGGATVPFVPVK